MISFDYYKECNYCISPGENPSGVSLMGLFLVPLTVTASSFDPASFVSRIIYVQFLFSYGM